MAMEIKGASPEDAGPAGVVAAFMVATTSGDTEGALARLTVKSREGGELHGDAMETAVVTFGEVIEEDGVFIVPTVTAENDEEVPMDLVVVEEDGELRIDMNATMAREMGMDPEEMLEQMAEGMGEMMEGVADAMGEAMGEAMSGMGDAMGEAMSGVAETAEEPTASLDAGAVEEVIEDDGGFEIGEVYAGEEEISGGETAEIAGRNWTLAGDGFPPEEIINVAAAASTFLDPKFDPELDELDTEQWGDDDSQTVTTRYGTQEQGYQVIQSRVEQEAFSSASITAAAYGVPGDQDISVSYSKTMVPDMEPQIHVTILMRAPKAALDAFGEMISEDGAVLSVVDC